MRVYVCTYVGEYIQWTGARSGSRFMRGSGLPRLSFLHSTWYLLTYRTVHTDPLGVLCDGVRRLVRWYTDKDKANARHY